MAGKETEYNKPGPVSSDTKIVRQKLTPIGEFLKGVLDPLLLPIVDKHWGCASILLIAITVLLQFFTGAALHSVFPSGTPGSALQAPYNFLRNLGDSSNIFYSVELTFGLYLLTCGFYTLLDVVRPKVVVDKLMYQPREAKDFGGEGLGLWRTVKTQCKAYTVLMPPYLIMAIMKGPSPYPAPWVEPCLSNCTVSLPEQAPSLLEFLVHFVFCLFINDFSYWYYHWMCHRHRALYKNIHALHHEYKQPFAMVTAHVHSHELLCTYFAATLPPIACRAHPFTAWIVTIAGTLLGIEAHIGYESPFSFLMEKLTFGAYGSAHHDLHHQFIWANYQPFFGYLDVLCGTGVVDPATKVVGDKSKAQAQKVEEQTKKAS